MDAERQRLSRHEAAHAAVAVLLNWRIKLVKVGAAGHGGGLIDVWPNFAVHRYSDPAVLPLLMFLLADAQAFSGGGYDGPLPATLPPGGMRVVSDIIAILLAGFSSEANPVDSYRWALAVTGSDAAQVEVLLQHYPAAVSIRDNLLAWMPGFLADELTEPVDAIAAVLLHPADTALASSLGAEDIDRVLAGIDVQKMAKARRRLNAQLDGLVLLATAASRAA